MTKAQQAVAAKMKYILNEVGRGPLVKDEREILLSILKERGGSDSLWAPGIRQHFESGTTDHDQFIKDLASQCIDDMFTMVCIVGQTAAIYLLRSVND